MTAKGRSHATLDTRARTGHLWPIMTASGYSICAADGLGRSLRLWRALRRVKQAHAAELLRVSQAMVSRWEAGTLVPDAEEQARLRQLMSARLDSAADHALARLVTDSSTSAHLVCDLTHRLLAASRGRSRDWDFRTPELLGVSLWRFATPEIQAAEAALTEDGWFEPEPPAVELDTGANGSPVVPIRQGRMRWTRLQLSDGAFVRLAETIA
jgi:transcriptional regulator with XRE-family HTH domain